MNVQIFGTRKSSDTRKAQRFFAERRIPVHFVDVADKPPSRRELLRFIQKFGTEALLDRESRRFQDLGLASAHRSDERWLETMMEEPLVLRLPLVREGNRLSVGHEPQAWKAWVQSPS